MTLSNQSYISPNVLLITTSNHHITLRYKIQRNLLLTTGLQEVLRSCLCNTFCPPPSYDGKQVWVNFRSQIQFNCESQRLKYYHCLQPTTRGEESRGIL
nr:hypothetical protein Iba_chr12cCG10060 [Ipomoea batatas]